MSATAPAERLAMFRVLVGVYAVAYFVFRAPVFIDLADRRPSRFDPVGVLWFLDAPLSRGAVLALFGASVLGALAVAVGWRFRIVAPLAALAVLLLTTYRSSWGQLLHFENLMTLHLLVVAFSPSADAWSLDARRRADRKGSDEDPTLGKNAPSERYGWPLRLAALITVTTYVIAGVAKLRYGGLGWLDGETLRNHIAYAAARLDVFGGSAPLAAEFAVRHAWVLGPAAIMSVALELGAPLALVSRRWRNVWVVATIGMHLTIALTMSIVFGYPLFGVAFAPLFHLERLHCAGSDVWARHRRRRDITASAQPAPPA